MCPRVDEDDDYGEDLDALNDPDLIHLPPDPEVNNPGSISDIDGERAMAPMGRPASARLYAQAAQFEGVASFRVFREVHGVPVGIGTIGKDCSEEEFISAFLPNMPQSGETGRFRIRLLDNTGNNTGHEAHIPISGDHAELRKLRARATEGVGGMGSLNIPGLDFVREQMAGAQSRQNLMNDALEEERRAARNERDRMADERVGIANLAAEATRAVMERAAEAERTRAQSALAEAAQRNKDTMEAERARNEMTQGTLTGFMATQLESMRMAAAKSEADARLREEASAAAFARQLAADDARYARERQLEADRAARERAEAEDRRRADRAEHERKAELSAAEAKRQREMEAELWGKRIERDRIEAEERRERDRADRKADAEAAARAHELRLKEMEVSAARFTAQGGSAEGLLVKGVALLKILDIDIKDVGKLAKGFLSRDEDSGGSGLVQVLDTLVDRVGGIVEKGIEANTAQQQMRALQSGMPWPALAGQPGGDGDDDDDEVELPSDRRGRAVRPPAVRQTAPAPGAPATASVPATASTGAPTQQEAAIPLGLPQQKAAREALRKLAEIIQTLPPEQHKDAVLSAIGGEPMLYLLIESTGLFAALTTAGVPQAVARAVVNDLSTDGRLPANLFK